MRSLHSGLAGFFLDILLNVFYVNDNSLDKGYRFSEESSVVHEYSKIAFPCNPEQAERKEFSWNFFEGKGKQANKNKNYSELSILCLV